MLVAENLRDLSGFKKVNVLCWDSSHVQKCCRLFERRSWWFNHHNSSEGPVHLKSIRRHELMRLQTGCAVSDSGIWVLQREILQRALDECTDLMLTKWGDPRRSALYFTRRLRRNGVVASASPRASISRFLCHCSALREDASFTKPRSNNARSQKRREQGDLKKYRDDHARSS